MQRYNQFFNSANIYLNIFIFQTSQSLIDVVVNKIAISIKSIEYQDPNARINVKHNPPTVISSPLMKIAIVERINDRKNPIKYNDIIYSDNS